MSPLVAAATGLAVGIHCATWGMFKDAPFEGFAWRTWVRSPIVATLIALALTQLLPLDFGTGAAAVVVLWGVTYGFERAFVEIYKTFVREQDQSKYTIPMQFAVGGKVVRSRGARLAAGAAYLGLGLLVLYGVHALQTRGPDLPRLLAIFLVASPGGWISAFGGAWKDAPIEGFHTFKFFRSPAMTYGYGLALSLLTPSYVLVFMGSIGYTVATIETYKTFFFPNKKRGKFQGRTPTHPEHLRTRWRFAPVFAVIWLGVVGTAVAAFTALALVLFLAPRPASAQSADTVTVSLADAERRALEHNPLLAGAEARIEVNRAQESRAKKARFLPELSLRNAYGIIPKQRGAFNQYGVLVSPDTLLGVDDMSWFTQLDVRLVQPLWTFGKLGSRIEAAGYAVEASEAGLEKTEADVLLMVRQLYWGVVLAQELEAAAADVLEKVQEADTTLSRQYEEGTATQNDLFKFQIFRYEVSRRYREVTAGLDQARAGLRAALGLGEGVTVRVETEALDTVSFALQPLSAYQEMARANRPELSELQAGISARRALMVAEQRDAWPTLFFAGSISGNLAPDRYDPRNPFWQNQTNYFRGGGVLGFEWNLNFSQHRAEAAVQRTEMVQLESQADALGALVEQEVRQAWLKAGRAYTDVEEGRAALQASENWMRAELQTYDIGMSEIKDLIDAFRANAEMKVTQLKNITDFNMAVAELSRRVGLDLSSPQGTS